MSKKATLFLFMSSLMLVLMSSIALSAEEAKEKVEQYQEAITQVDRTDKLVLDIEVSINTNIGELADLLGKHGYAVPEITATPGTATYAQQEQTRNDAVLELVDDPKTKENLKGNLSSNELNILQLMADALLGNQNSLGTAEGTAATLQDLLSKAMSDLPILVQQILTGDLKGLGLDDVQKLINDSAKSLDTIVKIPNRIGKILGIIEKVLSFIFFFL